MLRKQSRNTRESGAVSLFIVVFAMLLITVVTLSFLRIMLKDQSQASINDLSKSALDSAQAGVEDAKRALIYYRTVCANGDVAGCAAARNTINSATCNQGLSVVNVDLTDSKEVPVQQSQSASDEQLNQAYTCVKMNLDTVDYLGTIEANSSKIIPLFSTKPFSSVILQWFTTDDFGAAGSDVSLQPNTAQKDVGGTNQEIWPLYAQANWPQTRPPVMRTQLMQFGSSFKLTDFDGNSGGVSNTNTMFLYPTGTTGSASAVTQDSWAFATRDVRQVATGQLQQTHCLGKLSGGGYSCSVRLDLPVPVGNDPSDLSRTAFLRLSAMYKSSHFRVTLMGVDPDVKFKGVQPSIDSTGRANDQYRRVENRVDLVDTNFPFPEAALDVSGNLCKDFIVTDTGNTIPSGQTCN